MHWSVYFIGEYVVSVFIQYSLCVQQKQSKTEWVYRTFDLKHKTAQIRKTGITILCAFKVAVAGWGRGTKW